MKKIFFLLVAVCTFFACDPTHEDISNDGHITVDELRAKTTVAVDQASDGKNGNVISCSTSAPVVARWDVGGKEFIGNSAWKKMKVTRDDNGNYIDTQYTIVLTARCPDGTVLTTEYPITCQTVTKELQKFYIYGDPDKIAETGQVPFTPGAWDAAAMRFSSTEGAHFPTIEDEVYDGQKTLIFDISDATEDCYGRVMNGWWSTRYDDEKDVHFKNGLWELPITEKIARDCAKKYADLDPRGGMDLDIMITSGSCTINSVYYEE